MKQSVKKTKLGPIGRLLKTAQQWTKGALGRKFSTVRKLLEETGV